MDGFFFFLIGSSSFASSFAEVEAVFATAEDRDRLMTAVEAVAPAATAA